MAEGTLSEEQAEELVSAARTAIGDELRSAVYFTADECEQVYLREGLEREADVERFVDNERLGFSSQQTYGHTELGDYQFTIRAFDHGYLTRVVAGDHGVFVTTDGMSIDRFEEVATALRGVLGDFEGSAVGS